MKDKDSAYTDEFQGTFCQIWKPDHWYRPLSREHNHTCKTALQFSSRVGRAIILFLCMAKPLRIHDEMQEL